MSTSWKSTLTYISVSLTLTLTTEQSGQKLWTASQLTALLLCLHLRLLSFQKCSHDLKLLTLQSWYHMPCNRHKKTTSCRWATHIKLSSAYTAWLHLLMLANDYQYSTYPKHQSMTMEKHANSMHQIECDAAIRKHMRSSWSTHDVSSAFDQSLTSGMPDKDGILPFSQLELRPLHSQIQCHVLVLVSYISAQCRYSAHVRRQPLPTHFMCHLARYVRQCHVMLMHLNLWVRILIT